MHVADPDNLKEMINDLNLTKAMKVRFWCLQVPMPKITEKRYCMASWTVTFRLSHMPVMALRLNRERSVQRLFLEIADKTIRHVIKNPHKDCPDTKITYYWCISWSAH